MRRRAGGGGWGRRVLQISKRIFVAQETINLNISWPSNFFREYFMAPSRQFDSYLRLNCSSISGYYSVIFKGKIAGEVDIHNNIQKIIS